MYSDSLTYNINPLPPDQASLFKNLIRSQDEVPEVYKKEYFIGNAKDIYPKNYIKQTTFNNDKSYSTSIFHVGNKQINEFSQNKLIHKQSDAVFYIFMFCLVIGTMIYFLKNKRIFQIFKAFYIPHFTNQLIRDGVVQKEFFAFPLLLIYFISLSLLITKSLTFFWGIESKLIYSFWILVILIVLYIAKIFIINFSKWCFKTQKETSEYNTNNFIFSIIIGIFLIPMVFLIYYLQSPISDFLLYFVLIIIALLFLYRTIRSFLIGLSSERYNLYYFILYLCTVEILPLIVTSKLLINFYLKGILFV